MNSYNSYPQLKKDIQEVKGAVEKTDSIDESVKKMTTGVVTPFRRLGSLDDKLKKHEYFAAAGLTTLAVVNLPEDCRDLQKGIQQINHNVLSRKTKDYFKNHTSKTGRDIYKNFIHYDALYDRKTYQHGFSFFRGTLLERFANPYQAKNKELAAKLLEADRSVLRSNFGEFVLKKLGVEEIDCVDTTIKDIGHSKKNPLYISASSFKGGSKFGRLTAKAMHRIPLLSVAALALIELPKIFKSHKEGGTAISKVDSVAKQTVKSGINVAGILAGIGYAGAAGSKYFGPLGSLVGMGVGAVAGAIGSKKIQELIG